MAKAKSKAKAKARGKSAKSSSSAQRARRSDTAAGNQNAIALLKADHRQVEEWFEQFEKARDDGRKQDLANSICKALTIHATIEEEIFYPAFLEATEDQDLHHEAEIEHEGAKTLIAKIQASAPNDEYFDAKVKVLSEMIKHHVKEEEKSDGMFAEARKSDMDLDALGEQLASRKAELEEVELADLVAAAARGSQEQSARTPR